VVLSACNTASARVLQGGSLLGFAAALIALGVGNVVAPLAPIRDSTSGAAMAAVHEVLTGGSTPAEALAATLERSGIDRATAGAFVVLGA
jgi:CHAT domain-containing protein